MTVSTTKMTARQFGQMGTDPEGVRLELVEGEIAVSPSPTFVHSHAMLELAMILKEHLATTNKGHILSDVDTVLGPHDVRRPDLLFVRRERASIITEQGVLQSPDLCIEIISPTSITMDREEKYNLYAKAGVTHYWIINPANQSFEAFMLESGKYVLAAKAFGEEAVSAQPFPNLQIPLKRLWWRK